jgi:uncharacterized protein
LFSTVKFECCGYTTQVFELIAPKSSIKTLFFYTKIRMPELKRTVVVGASTRPGTYAEKALLLLQHHRHPVIAMGRYPGLSAGQPIETEWNTLAPGSVHTVTLYLNPTRQAGLLAPILALQPQRVVFNPGTENPTLAAELNAHGISTEEACTLVLLHTGQY